MIWRTELKAVPHASLGYHFLRVQRILEVFKRRRGQKRKSRSKRQMTTYVHVCGMQLALYDSPLQMLKFKQVHRADQALLPAQVDSFVGCSLHCALHPPARQNENKNKTIQEDPCDYKGHTHTHVVTPSSTPVPPPLPKSSLIRSFGCQLSAEPTSETATEARAATPSRPRRSPRGTCPRSSSTVPAEPRSPRGVESAERSVLGEEEGEREKGGLLEGKGKKSIKLELLA